MHGGGGVRVGMLMRGTLQLRLPKYNRHRTTLVQASLHNLAVFVFGLVDDAETVTLGTLCLKPLESSPN